MVYRRRASIVSALHRYRLRNGHWPSLSISSSSSVPLLSWRVAILPDLGYQSLYERFDKNSDWTSPANRQLLTEMPIEFQPVNADAGILTPVAALATSDGKWTISDTTPNSDSDWRNSRNIAFVELRGKGVPWTSPADLPMDANEADAEQLSSRQAGLFRLDGDYEFSRAPMTTSDIGVLAFFALATAFVQFHLKQSASNNAPPQAVDRPQP
ncbi:MAG: DUF1559 domain-containing protein [Pirellulales bacterium]